MCTYELQLKQAVNQVTFHTDPKHSGDMAVLDADNKITVYRYGESMFHYCFLTEALSLTLGISLSLAVQGLSELPSTSRSTPMNRVILSVLLDNRPLPQPLSYAL